MNKNLLNKLWLRVGMIVAIMTTALAGTAWAETIESNFTDKNLTVGTGELTWTASPAFNSFESSNSARGAQSAKSTGTITLTAGSSLTNISKIEILCSSNAASVAMSAKVGNTTFGTSQTLNKENNKTITFTSETAATGVITISANRTENGTFWVKSITVTYTPAGSNAVATPTFSPEAGVYTSAQNVTISTETSGATIYYTTDGSTPTTSSSVYSSAISVNSTTTIKAIAVKSGMTNSDVASATYTIVNLDHAGTEADPYSVADAITLLTAAPSTTFENVYVSGIISQVDSYNSTYNSITYWISDDGTTTDQFEVYGGLGLNGAGFSSKDDLIVGSAVTVKGNIKKYNSTFEFDVNSEIVSLVEPTYPIINVEDVTLDLEYDATSGEIEYTITNATSATLTATSSASWISNITVDASSVTFTTTANEGTADRTATITLSYTGAEDVTVTVTQGHYVADVATLPFEFDGGKAAIANIAGLTESGLGSDYSSSPKLKFDGTGDYVILHFNERPGTLTFDIKGNGFSQGSTSTFKVQTSTNGTTWVDLKTYTELATLNEEFNNLDADVRYIRWIYIEKGATNGGNVALGGITLSAYEAPANYTLTIPVTENVNISAAYGSDGIMNEGDTEEIEQGTAITLTVDVAEGYVLQSLTVSGGEGQSFTPSPVSGSEGAYTFTMPAYNATVNATVVEYVAPVEATYVLATSITSGKRYVIASGTEDGTVQVMGNQANNNRPAVEATITDGVLSVSDEYEFVIESATIDEVSGYSIYDENVPGYLYAASSGSNYLRTQATNDVNGVWTITIDATTGEASVVAEGSSNRNVMHFNYNGGSPIFSCYAATSSITAPVYFFEKVEEEEPITVTVGEALYMTYVAPETVSFIDVEGLTAYLVTEKTATSVTLEQIDAIEEGVAVVLKADAAGTYTLNRSDKFDEVDVNLLQASDGTIEGGEGSGIYALAKKNGVVGFYPVGNDKNGNPVVIPAGKAYIDMGKSGAKEFYGFEFAEDDPTGISNLNANVNLNDGAIYNLAGQRLQKMQKGINIVNGKKIMK